MVAELRMRLIGHRREARVSHLRRRGSNKQSTRKSRRLERGILFPNQAGIIDRTVASNKGRMNEHFEETLRNFRNEGILTSKSLYSRCIFGRSRLTGNPITVEYGKTKPFKNIPDQRVTLFTKSRPATAAELRKLVDGLKSGDSEIQMSLVEVTFDVTGFGVLQFRRQLIYRARTSKLLKYPDGSGTLYVGGPKSAWQVRIYEKGEGVVRLEFIFRRAFLSRHGINAPEDVLLLRRFKLWNLLSVRQFSQARVDKATTSWDEHDRRIAVKWNKNRRGLQGLAQLLRRKRINPAAVLRKAPVQRKLESMLRRLIW